MIPYSLHVALILGVCLAFYKLLLQRETYYHLNRAVLLGFLALAFVLPLVPVPERYSFRVAETSVAPIELNNNIPDANYVAPPVEPLPSASIIEPSRAEKVLEVPLTERLAKWVFWIYWCGVVILGANFLVQLIVMLYQSYRRPAIKDGIFRIVELENDKAPCSFGNTIFINPSKYDWDTYSQIIIHEKIHIQQGHSLDLLLAELVIVLQWFNPFAWWYRKELESNLEFLVDHAVLNHHQVEMQSYQLSLLKVAVPNWSMNITTNYNQSLLKKRIVMMSTKKSNVHIMWKYFIILPLMVVLVASLNKPMAAAEVGVAKTDPGVERFLLGKEMSQSKGLWFATIKDDKINIEFKSDGNDENRRWSSSANFDQREFSSLPRNEKAEFTITREAGTIVFNGKFDEDQGYGRYKFTVNKEFKEFAAFKNIKNMEDEEYFSFFLMNVKRSYVQFLNDNGFKELTKNQIISMSAFKIDAPYINYWKRIGYTNITPNNLVSLKSLKIDSVYVEDIRKAGYTDLTIQQLISFKSQRITGEYINSLRKAKLRTPSKGELPQEKPSAAEIVRSKAMNVDTNYIAAVRDAGFPDLSSQTINTLKSQQITPAFIKGFQDIGLTNLTTNNLLSLKNQNITPEFIKGFQQIGFKDVPLTTYFNFKSQKLTPEFVKGFQDIGLKDMSLNTLYTFKTQNITPEFIKGFQDVGLKNVPLNTYQTFKMQGITPEFIKGFKDVGFGDISFNQYYTLKSRGVTADFVKGFKKLGFTNISVNQLLSLRYYNVTPEFVADMKQKGFDLKDLEKYIQLKNLNTSSAQGGTSKVRN